MRQKSTEISNSEKVESDSSVEDFDSVDEKMVSSNCVFEPLLDRIVEKRANETEHLVYVDKPADDFEVSKCKEEKSIVMEDKKVLVSTENIIASCAEREIYECAPVKCVTVPFRERKYLGRVNLNELDPSLKEEINSSPHVKPGSIVDDDNVVKKGKRGRKRKTLVTSECNGDTKGKKEKVEQGGTRVSGRVLRSRPLTSSGLDENLVGFKRKMEAECLNQTELKEVNEKSQRKKKVKKQKRRGRPPKAQIESTPIDVTDDVAVSKKSNIVVVKKVNNQLKGEDVEKGANVKLERREIQQLVRDKIVKILMKAGWTIEHRPRNGREYLDAVYVDLEGRTHWSVTKAYFSLKKSIEKGEADDKEVSAFTPVPDEELSVLFRTVTKVRSDKHKERKNNKKDKGIISKGKIVIKEESEDPPKKKLKKKLKDGKKKKEVKLGKQKVSQKSQQSRKPRLLARSSVKNDEENDGSLIYDGKRNILSWMIDLGVVMPGGKVQYNEGKKRNGLLEGKVTRDGIHCSCCNETFEISRFVSHGGGKGKLNQELENIYFQSSSLLKCLQESWKKEEDLNKIKFNLVDVEGDDPNDDTCNICGDGGDLICCDGCPSTFHQSCLDIKNFPSGDWHCVYCSCKFCGLASDDSDHATDMISCCLCEEKFHGLCIQENDAPNLDSSGRSFCGGKCQEIFEKVQTYIGVKFELEDGFSWTLLQRADVSKDSLLLDASEKIECNSKLAVAFSVMDECFVPIMDERSGVNVIHDVVYNCGSNFRRLDYSGFFTAILERGDELISAASIRIHGHRLAEMPFIGTRHMYRRQGMCHRLLDAIESALSCVGVGELVIPAIPELYKTWTNVFGFKPLKKSKRQAMKSMSMIVFPGLDILHKPLLNNHFADRNLGPAGDDKAVGCITAVNDDNALDSQTKPSNQLDDDRTSESESPTTAFQVPEATNPSSSDSKSEIPLEHVSSDSDVQSSDELACEHNVVVIKNTFDLNLQPAVTDNDTDIQSNDQDSFTRDPQVCNTQPLVVV